MQEPHSLQPAGLQLLGPEPRAGPSLPGEGSLAIRPHQHRYDAGRLFCPHGPDVDAALLELGDQPAADGISAHPGEQTGRLPQARGPGAEVGGLAAASDPDLGLLVVVDAPWSLGSDGHIQNELTDGGDQDPGRLMSASQPVDAPPTSPRGART